MPARPTPLALARAVASRISNDHLTLVAAGVAFYALMALFPALAAMLGIYGLVADPALISDQLGAVAEVVPTEVSTLVEQQLTELASGHRGTLSLSVGATLALSLWSATQGTFAFMRGLSIAFACPDKRGMVHQYAVALLLTAGVIVGLLVVISLVAVVPAVLAGFGLPLGGGMWGWTRWPITVLVVAGIAGQLYRRGPDHADRPQRALTVGSLSAGVLQLVGSAGFSWYVGHFGSYNETYGSMGAVVVLMMWLYLFALVLLIGAEIDAAWSGIRPVSAKVAA